MDDYISKPLDVEKLQEQLDRWGNAAAGDEPVAAPAGDQPSPGPVLILNPRKIADLRSLDPDNASGIFGELIMLFLDDLATRLDTLRAARARGDAAAVAVEAHSIKGSAGNPGAERLAVLCKEVEMAARQGALTTVDDLLPVLEEEAVRVRQALDAELALQG